MSPVIAPSILMISERWLAASRPLSVAYCRASYFLNQLWLPRSTNVDAGENGSSLLLRSYVLRDVGSPALSASRP